MSKWAAHTCNKEIICCLISYCLPKKSGLSAFGENDTYDSKLMKLYVVGGGGCLIRNFSEYDKSRITVNDDICATAKGYERMLEMKLIKSGGTL